ncbi:hypothetical protein Glove_547g31 [Diversispora epigaea]|uniref:C2H2-type domain-containing protein n=1 Tax=Diversispora epigaea TaxID=1348612 RepID=A0A397GKE8_9GLOM|nr:hypothetical protein Glove_547g31 [Diversispora epigaea]
MSVNFKCLYCDRYLSSRNAYSQHVKYCNELKELNISTEESNNDISDTVSSINEMSLDSDDFSQIEELQSIREENLPPVSKISYQYESDSNYADKFENLKRYISTMKKYVKKCLKTSVKILNFNLKTMSVNFKCLYCDRYLSSRNTYSQHVKYCNELKELNISTEESNNDISDTVSSINEMSLDSDDFSQIEELQSIREENLPPVSEISYQYESDSNYAGDVSLRSEEFENFDEILSESLQNYTEKSDTNMSNTLEEFEPKSLTLQDNIEESEVEIKEFPNEAYADLMTLVTKHNLSNKAGNSIIKFFNRHSDLSQSPLPKNIETDSQELKINVEYKFTSSEKLKISTDTENLMTKSIYFYTNYRLPNCDQH